MAYHIQCTNCLTSAYADCSCPSGHVAVTGVHHDSCQMQDLDSLVACKPGKGCCNKTHDHGAAANACPGGHGPCPVGPTCEVVTPAGEECPGGHCAKEDPDCTVCRPLIITAMPGSSDIQVGFLEV